MSDLSYSSLLDLILDSWDRNNRILINLLRALPPGGLEARAHPTTKRSAHTPRTSGSTRNRTITRGSNR